MPRIDFARSKKFARVGCQVRAAPCSEKGARFRETIAISRRYSAGVMEHATPASLAGVITWLATTPEGPFAYFRIPPAILRSTYARHARRLRDANFTRAGQGLARGLSPPEAAPAEILARPCGILIIFPITSRPWKRGRRQ